MPPRKKAAAPSTNVAGVTKPASSRSTRTGTRQASAQAVPASTAAVAAKPVSKPKSSKTKRALAVSDDEADEAPAKKAKVVKDNDTADSKADDKDKKMVCTRSMVMHQCSYVNV